MMAVRMFLVITAAILSAMPIFWMALITDAQIGNLQLTPPYWRELMFALAFWIGLMGSLMFARRCFLSGLRPACTPLVLVLIAIGIAGGIAEEYILLNNPKTPLPFGYFELAPLSWIIVGIVVSMLPNPAVHRTLRDKTAQRR